MAIVPIIDWTEKVKNFNERITSIVLHHTVTDSAQTTLNIFNKVGLSSHYLVDKDGAIYRLVKDDQRAWHAGVSFWKNRSNLNDTSIGIEMVNLGDRPFTEDQIDSVSNLCKDLMVKFKVGPRSLVAHADIAPGRKFDPSGYFDWKRFYKNVGVFGGLFDSKLNPEDQKEILLDSSSGNEKSAEISSLQNNLSDYGFKIDQTGKFENETRYVVEAFNRHFSPEIFVKEIIKDEKIVQRPENQKWYKISQERLDYLLTYK